MMRVRRLGDTPKGRRSEARSWPADGMGIRRCRVTSAHLKNGYAARRTRGTPGVPAAPEIVPLDRNFMGCVRAGLTVRPALV